MATNDLLDILGGKIPEASKEEMRLAAKRIHDRKRYAEKTNLNWKQDDSSSRTMDSHNVLGVNSVSETNSSGVLGKGR